ncbi:MAG: alpha-L-fucosidase, partial [Bacteroidales bacterium]|nr:alpha-L-fucosidase [Bacteroidales bacterium]
MKNSILFFIVSAMLLMSCSQNPSAPDFSKQLQWWEEARYGMFVHWGISTMEGMEISWPRESFGPEKYDSLSLRFNPVDFDANAWIDAAEKAGMKYIVLTTKHHDGFCLWDTKTTEHNIMNTPYGKDVLKQLADAAHERGMRLGWYWSVRQWDDANCSNADPELNNLYIEKMKTQLKEILTNYGKIDLLWFD